MSAESRLEEIGVVLPAAPRPLAAYVTIAQVGNLLYTAGHGPLRPDGSLVRGKVGADLGTDAAYEAARFTGTALLATVREYLGSLDRVERVVKVLGMVNAVPEYEDHSKVIDGCSDLMVEIFGDAGRHARSAVGVGSLPGGIPVEIEAIVEVRGE